MKNTSSQKQNIFLCKKIYSKKGITSISLVITIIVMLILVGVTINVALNGGLFRNTKKAARDTKEAMDNENALASGQITVNGKDYDSAEDYLNNKLQPPKYSKSLLDETTGVLKENARYISDGKTAIIPKGFKVSDIAIEQTIEGGLVVKDKDNNEYVWIPVKKAIVTRAEIAKLREEDSTLTTDSQAVQKLINSKIYPMAIEMEEIVDEKSVINYKGILYNFSGTTELTGKMYYWTSTALYREPANLKSKQKWNSQTTVNGKKIEAGTEYVYDSQEMFTLFDLGTYSETLYQDSYNKMIKSVAKNGGFYVGRYEASLYTDKTDTSVKYAQCKKDQTALVSTVWYDMYKYARDYSEKNTDLGVTSEMIWGSQWDQMLIFINGKNDGNKPSVPFYVTQNDKRESGDATTRTGMNEKDQVANIFDIEAGRSEWTQEAYSSTGRARRSSYCIYYGKYSPPSNRGNGVPSITFGSTGFRSSLYIK